MNNQMNKSLAPDISMQQDEPSEFDKSAMNRFLLEFVYDKDPEKAALRCGIHKSYAKQVAQDFIDTQYFQLKLKDYESNKDVLLDDMELLRKELVKQLLDIVKYNGAEVAQSARIAASKEITTLMGLNTQKQSAQEDVYLGSVMVIPASLPVDVWSEQAVASQSALHKQLEASL